MNYNKFGDVLTFLLVHHLVHCYQEEYFEIAAVHRVRERMKEAETKSKNKNIIMISYLLSLSHFI